jgi:DNA-binding NarL/FixJ family response regulator
MKISIGIVDDHQLFLKSLSLMLASFNDYEVILEALNGKELQEKISAKNLPDIILLDVNMPVMGGVETAAWLKKNYASVKLVALSMNDNDKAIIAMIKAGCCAYLLKDIHPDELETALQDIHTKGFYYADEANTNYSRLLVNEKVELKFTESEKHFLQLCCSEMPYKEIASKMNVSVRTVDWHRENMFKKFGVQNRIGLVLESIRRDLVKV